MPSPDLAAFHGAWAISIPGRQFHLDTQWPHREGIAHQLSVVARIH